MFSFICAKAVPQTNGKVAFKIKRLITSMVYWSSLKMAGMKIQCCAVITQCDMTYYVYITADLSGISISLNSNSQKTPYDFLEVSLISSASQWLGFHVPDLIGSVCAEMPWNTFHCGCCASNKNFMKTSLDMIGWLLHIWALHTFNSLNHTGVVGACAKILWWYDAWIWS